MNEENNVLTIKTVQIQPIRNIITAIKDILTDATITFTNGTQISSNAITGGSSSTLVVAGNTYQATTNGWFGYFCEFIIFNNSIQRIKYLNNLILNIILNINSVGTLLF